MSSPTRSVFRSEGFLPVSFTQTGDRFPSPGRGMTWYIWPPCPFSDLTLRKTRVRAYRKRGVKRREKSFLFPHFAYFLGFVGLPFPFRTHGKRGFPLSVFLLPLLRFPVAGSFVFYAFPHPSFGMVRKTPLSSTLREDERCRVSHNWTVTSGCSEDAANNSKKVNENRHTQKQKKTPAAHPTACLVVGTREKCNLCLTHPPATVRRACPYN